MNNHKFKYNFSGFLNSQCSCNLEPETTFHYLPFHYTADIKEIDEHMLPDHKSDIDQIFLYGNKHYNCDTNQQLEFA